MIKNRLASGLASFGAGINFLTSGMHFSRYAFVASQATSPDWARCSWTDWC